LTDFREQIPREIIEEMLSHGSCSIISDPHFGKTNLAKIIVSEMVRYGFPAQHKVFDCAQVWRHIFLSSFKFQEINEETRQVWDGDDNVLFDVEYDDSERIMQFMGNAILRDYEDQRKKKKFANGKLGDYRVYTLEEAQNSLGRYALNRTSGKYWLKIMSEAANFNLFFILIGQRAQDVSTQAIERAQTRLIGRTTGDNNTRKLQGLVGKGAGINELGQPLHEVAKTLKVGEFIWWNGSSAYRFTVDRFEDLYPGQKPQEVKPPEKRWVKLW
jgi:hypothetical protein